MYEHRKQPLLSTAKFLRRLARHGLVAFGVMIGGLGIGVVGYHTLAHLSWIDSLLNASMILAGMGPVNPLPSNTAKIFASCYWFVAAIALAGMIGCAQIKKPMPQVKAAPTGLRFDQVGRVALYVGEPCTPQIMFDFHGGGPTVLLAAPKLESETLTEAANKNQRVHVWGKWRRGGQSKCSYVEVTTAELTR